jgi:hypothetical protein
LFSHKPTVRLALTGIVPVLAVLAFSPFVAHSAFWQASADRPAQLTREPAWAGGLETAETTSIVAEPTAAVRSASYTSGFDPAAAGLVSPKSSQAPHSAASRDGRGCLEEGNDPAHLLAPCVKAAKVAQPAPRPVPKPLALADTGNSKAAGKSDNGLFGFAPRLPSANQLLSPFTFVGDKVSSLFKRS